MKKAVFFLTIFLFFAYIVPLQATTIFSPLLELEVDVGQTQAGVVKVYNETDQDLFLISSVENFAAAGEGGQVTYQVPGQEQAYLDWFELAQGELLLKPKQVALVPFTVTVPANALPGGYYAAIFWQSQAAPVEGRPGVGISSKVGTLVFLKVNGQVNEEARILDFKTQGSQDYFFELPVTFLVRFENTGNIHLKPSGQIQLNGWFTNLSLPVNEVQRNVLPGSVRRFDIVWGQSLSGSGLTKFYQGLKAELQNFALGKYQATLTLSYGEANDKTLTKQLEFWLIPYRLIISLILALLVLLVLLKVSRRVKKLQRSGKKVSK